MPTISIPGIQRNIKVFEAREGGAEFRARLKSVYAAGGRPIEAGECQHVRDFLRRRRLPIEGRAFHERKMAEPFNPELSLLLDSFLEWDDLAPIRGALQSNRMGN